MARGSGTPQSIIQKSFEAMANVQMGAKLGSAVIVHATSNPFLETLARAHYGLPVARLIGDVAKGFQEAPAREIARAGLFSQDAMHSLEQGARELGVLNRMVNATKILPYLTTHYSGLEAGVNALRRAWWWAVSGEVTNQLGKDFADVPERLRGLLTGFGMNEADWKNMQAAQLYEPQKGVPFLRANEIGAVEGGQETALKYLEMLHQSMEFAVPSSRWRSRAALTLGTKSGTTAGLLMRSFAMFKGFVGSATISYLEALRHELSRNKGVGAAAAVGTALTLTMLGTLALQLKGLSAGKDLRSMDPTTKDGLETIGEGFLTSGAASIYGDFLHADQTSYGHGPLETLAGPVVTGALDAYGAARHLLTGKTKAKDPESGVVKFLRNDTPVLSTHWALRAAYNRILMDQLQYMADPEAHRKMRNMESNLARDTGQSYWWRPGQSAPDRFPGLTPGR